MKTHAPAPEVVESASDPRGQPARALHGAVTQLTARYEAFAVRLARLLSEKQAAYGDSFGHSRDVLKILFPRGVPAERYGDLLTITRIVDKLFRVANQKDYGGESPYQDIAGYAILAACRDEGVASTSEDNDQEPIDLV